MPLISFSCLPILARTSSTIFTRNGESEHPCLLHYLIRKLFNFSPLNVILVVRFSYMDFIMFEWISSLSHFCHEMMLNFTKCFLCNYWDDHVVFIFCSIFPFILLMWYITLVDLCMLNHTWIPGLNPTWLWHMILLM